MAKTKQVKTVLVIGCGRMGASIASLASEENKDVTVVDIEEDSLKRLPASYGGNTLLGDGMDRDVLVRAGIKQADTIVAATDSDNVNLFIGFLAKTLYQTGNVVCRLYDNSKQTVVEDRDIDTICPPELSVRAFKDLIDEEVSPDGHQDS